MDHIPRIQSSTHSDIRVKCFCMEPCDGYEFSSYPFRRGWCRAPGSTLIWDTRPRAEQLSIVQTWLYFGMLDQVFGHRIALTDFVDDDDYLTTARLSHFTRDWYERLHGMSASERLGQYLRSQACLGEARSHCILLLDSSTACTPEVLLSIRILGESLSNAAYRIWEALSVKYPTESLIWPRDLRGKWGYSGLLAEELLAKNWCPSDIAFLQQYPPSGSNSGMYYARGMVMRDLDHSRCSRRMCLLSVVDSQSYVQRHICKSSTKCEGSCRDVTPSQEKVRAILVGGGVPLLRASTKTAFNLEDIDLDIVEYQPGMEYTAISHVWSDGLGNPKSNSILECQARFLVQSIADVRKAGSGPGDEEVFFWIDTLLVPTGRDKNLDNAKTLALNRMLDTYQTASSVLVFSMDLFQRNPSDGLEAAVALLCSKWMRRLWTLQEGVLGKDRLHVLFEHGPMNLSSIIKDLNHDRQCAPWTEHALISFATRLGLLRIKNSQGRDRVIWVVGDLNWRPTSVATDEALVFATMAGQGPQALLQVPPETRMKTAVRLARVWPSRTIFAPGPRFHEEGYRWALKTFLSPSTFTFTGYVVKPPNFAREQGLLGITVTYPGYIINKPVLQGSESFLLLDREAMLWLRIRRPLDLLENTNASDKHNDAKKGQSPYFQKMGLMLCNAPWMSKHSYGALVALDEFDGATAVREVLSGPHQGAFDVLVPDLEGHLSGEIESKRVYSSEGMLKEQKWVIR